MRNKRLMIALLLAAVSASACDRTPPEPSAVETNEGVAAQPTEDHLAEEQSAGDVPEALNPVQHEMQLLTAAMKSSLDAIANNSLSVIPTEIAKVHPAKVATGKALEAGTYKTPYNADKMKEFAELDEVFHDQLRALLTASKNNDTKAAAAAYGELVQGCANCHTNYRFPAQGQD